MPVAPTQTRSGLASLMRAAIGPKSRLPNSHSRNRTSFEAALLRLLARAHRDEVQRREFAGHDGDGLRRLRCRGGRAEHEVGPDDLRITGAAGRGELHVVLGQAGRAEAVVHQDLVVTLCDAHRREYRSGAVRPHDEVDLVDRDELLVERARHVRARLIVLHDPFHLAAEQAAALVQVLDEHLGRHLLDGGRGGEGAGER